MRITRHSSDANAGPRSADERRRPKGRKKRFPDNAWECRNIPRFEALE
jgi:hypothetical protein